jgi:hypothetical protein
MFTTYRNPTRYDVRRVLVPPPQLLLYSQLTGSTNNLMMAHLKAETCSCILHIVAYYVVIPSDKLLCFWLHVYVNIHIIIYIVLTSDLVAFRCLRVCSELGLLPVSQTREVRCQINSYFSCSGLYNSSYNSSSVNRRPSYT